MLSPRCQGDLQVGTQFSDEGEDHETGGEEKRGDVLPPSEICCLTNVCLHTTYFQFGESFFEQLEGKKIPFVDQGGGNGTAGT